MQSNTIVQLWTLWIAEPKSWTVGSPCMRWAELHVSARPWCNSVWFIWRQAHVFHILVMCLWFRNQVVVMNLPYCLRVILSPCGFRFTGCLQLQYRWLKIGSLSDMYFKLVRDGTGLIRLLAFSLLHQWLVSCCVTNKQWGLSNCNHIQFLPQQCKARLWMGNQQPLFVYSEYVWNTSFAKLFYQNSNTQSCVNNQIEIQPLQQQLS